MAPLDQRNIYIRPLHLKTQDGVRTLVHEFEHDHNIDNQWDDQFTPEQLRAASFVNPDHWDGWRDEEEGYAVIASESLICESHSETIVHWSDYMECICAV